MIRKKVTPLSLQKIVLSFLVITAPFAMTFTPYEGSYTSEMSSAEFQLDSLYYVRAGLIIAGMIAAVTSLFALLWGVVKGVTHGPWKEDDILLQISMTICSFSVGWAAFPYWINGVFQAYIGNATMSDFDPSTLMPMIWIGWIWYIVVLLIVLAIVSMGPILLLVSIALSIKEKTWLRGLAHIFSLSVSAAIFFSSHNYFNWFAD